MQFFHRWKSHFSLLASGYILAASRMVAVFALRLVADPLTVGVINTVQTVINITNTLSLGATYATMRAIPVMEESDKARHASASLTAVLIEGVVTSFLTATAVGIIAYGKLSWPINIFFFAMLFSMAYRLQVYFENTLQALCRFKLISSIRFMRVLEPAFALTGIYLLGISGYLGFSVLFIGYVLIWNWRKLGPAFLITKAVIHEAIALLKKPNGYGMWIAAERFIMGLSSMADALLVTLVLGPIALSGYYLGVNIRGLLQQVASTFIFHRWSHAVNTYENAGKDIFSNSNFLTKYLLLSTALLGGTFLALYGAFEWILPSYKKHFLECMCVSAVAIPYSFTGFLRVSQLLAMKGRQLLLLSFGRLGLLAAGYGLLTLNHVDVTAPIIGGLAYATAAVEFTVNYFIVTRCSVKASVLWLSVCLSPVLMIMLFDLAI